MGLVDCPKCWDALCCCGWEYRNWSLKKLEQQKKVFETIIAYRSNHPNAKFATGFMDSETKHDTELMKLLHEIIK